MAAVTARMALAHGLRALLLVGARAATVSAQQPAIAAPFLVLDGVTVVDVEHGELQPGQRVVIVGNRIRSVGGTGTVSMPNGAQVVKAEGKYLIPGLWDMHVHMERDWVSVAYPLFLANGVTGIRDAWSSTPLDTLLQWWREIVAGTRVGPPRQLQAGPSTFFRGNKFDAAEAEHWVDSLKTAGANFLKMYPLNFTVAAAARRAGMPFGGHVAADGSDTPSATEASDSGMSIVDHLNTAGGLDKLCWTFEGNASDEVCRPVAERFQRNGTWWAPTITGFTIGLDYAGSLLGSESQAVTTRFNNAMAAFWADTLPHGNWLRDPAYVDAHDSLGLLHVARRAGLPMLAGTDVQRQFLKTLPPGFGLHAELATFMTEGLTALEALQTATLNPAKLIHGTDSLGTVAPGKLADLVLLDADPLADITNTTMIRAVVANGRYFDRAALDGLLTEVQAKAKKEP